jgi:pimeloyl-ACP methyl ester carboxylesterase
MEPSAPPQYWNGFTQLAELSPVQVSRFTASDDFVLTVYELGRVGAPLLTIVNPIHMPFLAMFRIASHLASRFRVVSYEVRGSAFLSDSSNGGEYGLARQCADLAEVAVQVGNPAHYLGWCNSARVLAWATQQGAISPKTITLVSPSGTDDAIEPRVKLGTLFGELGSLNTEEVERTRSVMATAFQTPRNSPDERLMDELFGLNFSTGERFRQYVRAKIHVKTQIPVGYVAPSTFDRMCRCTRVQVICGENDQYISAVRIRNAVARNPTVKMLCLQGADHAPTLAFWREIADATAQFALGPEARG